MSMAGIRDVVKDGRPGRCHDMTMDIPAVISEVREEILAGHVRALEGLRHAEENYRSLEQAACYIEGRLGCYGLRVESETLHFRRRSYRNVVATIAGAEPDAPWLLVGAHYDGAFRTPGADDNASGTAVLLEVARLLAGKRLLRTVQLVAFTLEERQSRSFSILRGSKEFVRCARESGRRYDVALVLECVGYTDPAPGRQLVPRLLKVPVPDTADFLAVIADRRSRPAMERFSRAAAAYVPDLPTVSYAVPCSGHPMPQTRWSDHASFWDAGYPALMLTDTAMFRNPYYHTGHDCHETLDYGYMARVARAVTAAVLAFAAR